MLLRAALALELISSLAHAAPTPTPTRTATQAVEARRVKSPELALTLAESAFEYRDFAKVIEFLDPWVHPPQIVDAEKLGKARELLGISHHLLGHKDKAKEEFEQVLLYDPDRTLDAFVVPPAVIATFEETREAMRPLLEQRRRALEVEAENLARKDLRRAHPLSVLAPLGLSHFLVLDRPAWGSLWLISQLLGLGANIGGYWGARSIMDADGVVLPEDEPGYLTATTFQYVGLGLFLASWLSSSIQGQLLLDAELEALPAERNGLEDRAASGSGFSPPTMHVSF